MSNPSSIPDQGTSPAHPPAFPTRATIHAATARTHPLQCTALIGIIARYLDQVPDLQDVAPVIRRRVSYWNSEARPASRPAALASLLAGAVPAAAQYPSLLESDLVLQPEQRDASFRLTEPRVQQWLRRLVAMQWRRTQLAASLTWQANICARLQAAQLGHLAPSQRAGVLAISRGWALAALHPLDFSIKSPPCSVPAPKQHGAWLRVSTPCATPGDAGLPGVQLRGWPAKLAALDSWPAQRIRAARPMTSDVLCVGLVEAVAPQCAAIVLWPDDGGAEPGTSVGKPVELPGLAAGDVVVAVDGEVHGKVAPFQRALTKGKPGEVLLWVWRAVPEPTQESSLAAALRTLRALDTEYAHVHNKAETLRAAARRRQLTQPSTVLPHTAARLSNTACRLYARAAGARAWGGAIQARVGALHAEQHRAASSSTRNLPDLATAASAVPGSAGMLALPSRSSVPVAWSRSAPRPALVPIAWDQVQAAAEQAIEPGAKRKRASSATDAPPHAPAPSAGLSSSALQLRMPGLDIATMPELSLFEPRLTFWRDFEEEADSQASQAMIAAPRWQTPTLSLELRAAMACHDLSLRASSASISAAAGQLGSAKLQSRLQAPSHAVRTSVAHPATRAARGLALLAPRFPRWVYTRGIQRQLVVSGHHNRPAWVVGVDASGTVAWTGADDGLVKVWSLQTGLLQLTLRGADGEIVQMAASPDNCLLAAIVERAHANKVLVWSLQTGQLKHVLHSHCSAWRDVAWDPLKSRLLYACEQGGVATMWDLDPQSTLLPQPGSLTNTASSAACPPAGVSTSAAAPLAPHPEQPPRVFMVMAAPAAGGPCGYTTPVREQLCLHSLASPPEACQRVAVHPLGGMVAILAGRSLYVWSTLAVSAGQPPAVQSQVAPLARLDLRCDTASVEWAPDGSALLTWSPEGTAAIWRWSAGWKSQRSVLLSPAAVHAHDSWRFRMSRGRTLKQDARFMYSAAAWSCDATCVFTASNMALPSSGDRLLRSGLTVCSVIGVWQASTGQLLATLAGHSLAISCLAPSPVDSHVLLSTGADGRICVWDVMAPPGTGPLRSGRLRVPGEASAYGDSQVVPNLPDPAALQESISVSRNADIARMVQLIAEGRLARNGSRMIAAQAEAQQQAGAGPDDAGTTLLRWQVDMPASARLATPEAQADTARSHNNAETVLLAEAGAPETWHTGMQGPPVYAPAAAALQAVWCPDGLGWLVTDSSGRLHMWATGGLPEHAVRYVSCSHAGAWAVAPGAAPCLLTSSSGQPALEPAWCTFTASAQAMARCVAPLAQYHSADRTVTELHADGLHFVDTAQELPVDAMLHEQHLCNGHGEPYVGLPALAAPAHARASSQGATIGPHLLGPGGCPLRQADSALADISLRLVRHAPGSHMAASLRAPPIQPEYLRWAQACTARAHLAALAATPRARRDLQVQHTARCGRDVFGCAAVPCPVPPAWRVGHALDDAGVLAGLAQLADKPAGRGHLSKYERLRLGVLSKCFPKRAVRVGTAWPAPPAAPASAPLGSSRVPGCLPSAGMAGLSSGSSSDDWDAADTLTQYSQLQEWRARRGQLTSASSRCNGIWADDMLQTDAGYLTPGPNDTDEEKFMLPWVVLAATSGEAPVTHDGADGSGSDSSAVRVIGAGGGAAAATAGGGGGARQPVRRARASRGVHIVASGFGSSSDDADEQQDILETLNMGRSRSQRRAARASMRMVEYEHSSGADDDDDDDELDDDEMFGRAPAAASRATSARTKRAPLRYTEPGELDIFAGTAQEHAAAAAATGAAGAAATAAAAGAELGDLERGDAAARLPAAPWLPNMASLPRVPARAESGPAAAQTAAALLDPVAELAVVQRAWTAATQETTLATPAAPCRRLASETKKQAAWREATADGASWLHRTRPWPWTLVPQAGDELVYIPQGHAAAMGVDYALSLQDGATLRAQRPQPAAEDAAASPLRTAPSMPPIVLPPLPVQQESSSSALSDQSETASDASDSPSCSRDGSDSDGDDDQESDFGSDSSEQPRPTRRSTRARKPVQPKVLSPPRRARRAATRGAAAKQTRSTRSTKPTRSSSPPPPPPPPVAAAVVGTKRRREAISSGAAPAAAPAALDWYAPWQAWPSPWGAVRVRVVRAQPLPAGGEYPTPVLQVTLHITHVPGLVSKQDDDDAVDGMTWQPVPPCWGAGAQQWREFDVVCTPDGAGAQCTFSAPLQDAAGTTTAWRTIRWRRAAVPAHARATPAPEPKDYLVLHTAWQAAMSSLTALAAQVSAGRAARCVLFFAEAGAMQSEHESMGMYAGAEQFAVWSAQPTAQGQHQAVGVYCGPGCDAKLEHQTISTQGMLLPVPGMLALPSVLACADARVQAAMRMPALPALPGSRPSLSESAVWTTVRWAADLLAACPADGSVWVECLMPTPRKSWGSFFYGEWQEVDVPNAVQQQVQPWLDSLRGASASSGVWDAVVASPWDALRVAFADSEQPDSEPRLETCHAWEILPAQWVPEPDALLTVAGTATPKRVAAMQWQYASRMATAAGLHHGVRGALLYLLLDLARRDQMNHLCVELDLAEFPAVHSLAPTCMNFGLMALRIARGWYRSAAAVEADADLLVSESEMLYGPGPQLAAAQCAAAVIKAGVQAAVDEVQRGAWPSAELLASLKESHVAAMHAAEAENAEYHALEQQMSDQADSDSVDGVACTFSVNMAEFLPTAPALKPSDEGYEEAQEAAHAAKLALEALGFEAANMLAGQGANTTASSARRDELFRNLARQLLKQADTLDTLDVFMHPVDTSEFEGYRNVVSEPMDFGAIGAMITRGEVRTTQQLARLVYLVYDNALKFNTGRNVYRTLAALGKRVLATRLAIVYDIMKDATSPQGAPILTMRQAFPHLYDDLPASLPTRTPTRSSRPARRRPARRVVSSDEASSSEPSSAGSSAGDSDSDADSDSDESFG